MIKKNVLHVAFLLYIAITVASFRLGGCSLPLFLYYITLLVNGEDLWSPDGCLLQSVDALKEQRKSPTVSARHIATILFPLGSVVCLKATVGKSVSKKIRALYHTIYQHKNDALLTLKDRSSTEATLTMKDLYAAYEELHPPSISKKRHNYDNFLTQFAVHYTPNKGRLERLLLSFPSELHIASRRQLVTLYGDHAYNREFIGINALPSSEEDAAPRPYLAYLVDKNERVIEIVGIYMTWDGLIRYLPGIFPNIEPIKSNKQQSYPLASNQTLIIKRTISYS